MTTDYTNSPSRADSGVIFLVMGVSASGKTTVGTALANNLPGYRFFEGDSFHPQQNIDKMTAGIALTDADRLPWLDRLAAHISARQSHAVYSCSALKRSYRTRILQAIPHTVKVQLVHLHAPFDVLSQRMCSRKGHFMNPGLLKSQFDTLELPAPNENIFQISCTLPVDSIISVIFSRVCSAASPHDIEQTAMR